MKLSSLSAKAVVWGLLLLAIATRFWDLGSKTFHHDESIHAWFSSMLAEGRGYHYDPVYHGPLLYHLEASAFRVFGFGDVQARATTAFFGLILAVLAYFLLKPHLGRLAAVATMALIVVSPTFSYYSRFNSHDLPIAVFTLVLSMVPFAYARTRHTVYVYIFLIVAALALSTKLNAWFAKTYRLSNLYPARTLQFSLPRPQRPSPKRKGGVSRHPPAPQDAPACPPA